MYRLLRAAAAMGVVRYDSETERFSSTELLQVLHPESPHTLKHFAQASSGPAFWKTVLFLPETVARGHNFVTAALGGELFAYFAQHQDGALLFSTGMAEISKPAIEEAVAAIEVGDARVAVDVGGGTGAFLCGVLHRHPQLTGVVLDLPTSYPGPPRRPPGKA